jgi:hypothetical protein
MDGWNGILTSILGLFRGMLEGWKAGIDLKSGLKNNGKVDGWNFLLS